jgi:DNA-binding MurR/RpiR family transcriptional regulator
MNDILSSVNQLELSDSEARIFDYISKHRDVVAWMTLEDLCNKLYVSNATIVRFTQKLGCTGFSEFKFRLRTLPTVDKQELNTILPKKAAQFDDIISSIQEEDILYICKSIHECSSFYIYGRNISSIPATYLYDMLTTIGIPCIIVDWFDALESLSQTISSTSLILMMSEHSHEEYLPIVQNLHKRGAKIVWICSSQINKESIKCVDLSITSSTNDETMSKLSTLTYVQAIIDMLETNRAPV